MTESKSDCANELELNVHLETAWHDIAPYVIKWFREKTLYDCSAFYALNGFVFSANFKISNEGPSVFYRLSFPIYKKNQTKLTVEDNVPFHYQCGWTRTPDDSIPSKARFIASELGFDDCECRCFSHESLEKFEIVFKKSNSDRLTICFEPGFPACSTANIEDVW